MTSTAARLEILQEYADWRDQVELAGVDSSIDAYREHLENLQTRDLLARISTETAKVGEWVERGTADPSDFESFWTTINRIMNPTKEIAPA